MAFPKKFGRLLVNSGAFFRLGAQSKRVILAAGMLVHSFCAARELRVGVISERPVEMIQYYNPLAQHLAGGLKHLDITAGSVVVARDLGDLLQRAKSGGVDIVFESAFATIELRKKAGLVPRLMVWKKRSRDYRTVFFTRKDSGIRTLDDLKSKVIAFEEPSSTSGYLVPKAGLILRGYTVIPAEAEGVDGAIKYVFARREINQAFQVLQRKVDAGAFSNNDWEEIAPKAQAELQIIHETAPVPRFVVSFQPSLDDGLRTAIEEILIQMDQTPASRSALQAAGRATKIDRLTEADLESLDQVRALMEAIER